MNEQRSHFVEDRKATADKAASPLDLVERVIEGMHKPPTYRLNRLVADIRAEYDAGAEGYYLPRPTMKWILDALERQA